MANGSLPWLRKGLFLSAALADDVFSMKGLPPPPNRFQAAIFSSGLSSSAMEMSRPLNLVGLLLLAFCCEQVRSFSVN